MFSWPERAGSFSTAHLDILKDLPNNACREFYAALQLVENDVPITKPAVDDVISLLGHPRLDLHRRSFCTFLHGDERVRSDAAEMEKPWVAVLDRVSSGTYSINSKGQAFRMHPMFKDLPVPAVRLC